jgi:hypothetical protein
MLNWISGSSTEKVAAEFSKRVIIFLLILSDLINKAFLFENTYYRRGIN